MKVKELISELQKLNQELEATILDGFNGGGVPRTINMGPIEWNGIPEFEKDERADYSDIESPAQSPIVVMGYGFY